MIDEYDSFINSKSHIERNSGFDPVWIPDFLFDFQQYLVDWAIRKGRGAVFADCGMGKTPMQLTVAQNCVEKTNGNHLIATPLAVSYQTVRESEKFGIEAKLSRDGKAHKGITVTNYEKLHLFDYRDFPGGVTFDESGAFKNFDSVTKNVALEFSRKLPYRFLYSANAAPNDYIELGNSSEILGHLGFIDMISTFFKKYGNTTSRKDEFKGDKYRFKGHSEKMFWKWVCSWARAMRKPSDYGFDDRGMKLPPLNITNVYVESKSSAEGMLFDLPAVGMDERREETTRTIPERCEAAASIANSHNEQVILWCHRIEEGRLLKKLVNGAVEVSGSDSDEKKEERFIAFANGEIRALVTKPTIAGWGMNFQNSHHAIYFPDDSYEKFYQSIRRQLRFGQEHPVNVHVPYTKGLESVLDNLMRKSEQADRMFEQLVSMMNSEMNFDSDTDYNNKIEVPSWL